MTRPSAETKLDQLSQTFMFSRRNLRLNGYDYHQNGAYFVTICAHQRTCLFGTVESGAMMLNAWGRISQEEWRRTESVRPNIQLDAFVIMPNHVHGVLMIVADAVPSVAGAQMNARTESDLQRVREYILAKPARWGDDDYFVDDGGFI